MVKSEWNSTFSASIEELTKNAVILFDGTYELWYNNIPYNLEIAKNPKCKKIFDSNLISNNAGEFESEEIVKENFKISDCSIEIVDGYIRNAVRLYDRGHSWSSLRYFFNGRLIVGTNYLIIAYIKVKTGEISQKTSVINR